MSSEDQENMAVMLDALLWRRLILHGGLHGE